MRVHVSPHTRIAPSVALVIAFGAAVWIAFRLRTGVVLEDALITFRHAENLAAGQGYGFNPGEWVQGSTTPLLTLFLAGLALLLGPSAMPFAATVTGIVAGTITAALTADLLRRWGCGAPTQAWAVGGWLLVPRVVWSGVGGMETPLVACFMALSLWAAARRDGRALGAALSLLLLTRPDGLLWVGLVVAATPGLWRRAWPFGAPLLAWIAWAVWAFGTPIPHAILAKSTVHPRGGPLFTLGALSYRLEWMSDAFSAPLPAIPALGWALLAAGLIHVAIRRRGLWLLPAVFVLALPVALHLGRAPLFFWYPVPAAWAAAVVGASVIDPLLRRIPSRAAWILVAAALAGGGWALRPTIRQTAREQENEDRMRAEVGRWLAAHTPPDATVLMEAIGYQGTLARRRVVDLAGLVSPQVVAIAREEASNARRFERILASEDPEAIVLRAWEVPKNRHFHGGRLFVDPAARGRFLERYEEAARFSEPHPTARTDQGVVVYVRRPSP